MHTVFGSSLIQSSFELISYLSNSWTIIEGLSYKVLLNVVFLYSKFLNILQKKRQRKFDG